MTRPIIKEVDLVNNTEIERQMNDAEFTEWQSNQIKIQQEVEEKSAQAEAKAALLDRLGITEDEAKLLLG